MLWEVEASDGCCDRPEGLGEKGAQLQCPLYAMCCCDVLALGGGKRDDLLALGGLGYSTAINEEHIACDGMSVLSHVAVCICIALEGSLSLSI